MKYTSNNQNERNSYMVNKQMALQKLAFTGTNPTVSCGKCNSAVFLNDLKEKEGKHQYIDTQTGQSVEGYKLEYTHDKCSSVVAGAVVWKHEMVD